MLRICYNARNVITRFDICVIWSDFLPNCAVRMFVLVGYGCECDHFVIVMFYKFHSDVISGIHVLFGGNFDQI